MSLVRRITAVATALAVAAVLFGAFAASVAEGNNESFEQTSVAISQEAQPEQEQQPKEEGGRAGLLGSTGTSMALVLALGVFAAAMVAGGRTATRRS